MARRKDLTALAALGTLGYMLSKKGDKASDKKDEKSTSDAAERRRAADKEASEEPKSIEEDSEEAANRRTERMLTNPNAREFGEAGTSMTVSPSKKPAASAVKSVAPKKVTAPSLGNDDYGSNTSRTSAPPSLGNDDYGSNTSRASASPAAAAAKPASSSRVPTPEQAAANRSAAVDKIKGVGSSVADYFSNFETPAKRKLREQKENAAKGSYARGGSVSSASRRADGIATKGKTRGKIC